MTIQAFTYVTAGQEGTTVDYCTGLLLGTLTDTNMLKFYRVSPLCLRTDPSR